jgi:hypothetical protein
VRVNANDTECRRGRAGDETRQGKDESALEVQGRRSQENEQKPHREHDESSRRLWVPHGQGLARRAIRDAHPREDISRDREREHRGPDIYVQRVEQCGRRGRPSKSPDPQTVKAEEQRSGAAGARQACSPLHWVGKDGPEAQGQRVGPAARKRGLDGQRRRAEHTHRKSRLHPGERQHHVRFSPGQTE